MNTMLVKVAAFSRKPAVVAKSLLFVFTLGMFAHLVLGADATDARVGSLVVLPWIIAPTAVAAVFATRAWSKAEAWLFVGAEVAAVASNVWLETVLILKPDAQNGLAILFFPLFQLPAVLTFALCVTVLAPFFRQKPSAGT